MLIEMDASSSPPPEALFSQGNPQSGAVETPAATETPSQISSSSLPTSAQASSQLSPQSQIESLSPLSFLKSIGTQVRGERSPQEQEAQAKEQQKIQAAIARARQDWERIQAQRKAQENERVQTTLQLKEQALQMGSYNQTSAVHSQTTQGDLSEQAVVSQAMKDAREERERQQKARASIPVGPQKGPQAEGGQKKTSTFAQFMRGGNADSAHKLSDDQDARQRQREQAMGE